MNDLDPPPSMVELISSNPQADAIWKKWFNNTYQKIQELVSGMTFNFNTDSANFDAFARLRVSNPETLFDSKQIHGKAPLYWDEATTGSGAAGTWSQNTASTVMDVDATTAGSIIRQTFQRFNYQPGKSQLILMTGTLDASGGGTGIIRGFGYGDENNGIFIVDDEGSIVLRKRAYTSGSAVDTDIAQADWNLDRLDGTGNSAITLDFSKSQIMLIDMEWLGVGRVRVGFVIDGIPVYCHQFLWANSNAGVYMSTPNLPIRYWIENDGTGAASTIEHICSSVMSEGGTQEHGTLRHSDTGAISGLSTGTTYAMIGIRLKSANIDAVVNMINSSMLCTTANDQAHWELHWNPTIAGTFTYADQTDSVVQIATGSSSNTVTNGYEIDGGYFSTAQPSISSLENALRLGSDISGTQDELVLTCTPITNNITVHASLTWREVS